MKYLLILIILSGCGKSEFSGFQGENKHTISNLEYIKDKYGICYAAYYLNTQQGLLTTVTCDKVGL